MSRFQVAAAGHALLCAVFWVVATLPAEAQQYDLDALPDVPEGFKAQFVAREPDLLHPVAIAFDQNGRLFVGGGPQFRWPRPDTPKDSIKILIDTNGDGVADQIKVFAEGFNCIQAMAWKGRDLWVAHSPVLTIVRDLDGDDVADEFVDVYTDLGVLRHGLHGLNWAPDGKLYMSQGDSVCTPKAPRAFRDLMHVRSDEPDEQPLRVYKRGEWQAQYIPPRNDSTEGGILRCDPDGKNLEIFSRGMRNPWDIVYDDQFNWVGSDNDDGGQRDRIFMAFFGAHFGRRHPWSNSWTGDGNPCTAPASGLFPHPNGSGVGIVYYTANHFPEPYRNCFFLADWTQKCIYYFKPRWDGALLRGGFDMIAWARGGNRSLFRPVDIEVGPDGALYVVGWGSRYGSRWAPYRGGDKDAPLNEGRIFRIWHEQSPLIPRAAWDTPKRRKPYAQWSLAELLEDVGHQIPVWRVNAQDELVRRGRPILPELLAALRSDKLDTAQQTWTLWAVGRIGVGDRDIDRIFETLLTQTPPANFNTRLQSLRIFAHRNARASAPVVARHAADPEPRLRHEAALTLGQLGDKTQAPALLAAIEKETDRLCQYSQYRALQSLLAPAELRQLLADKRPGARRAALLALLETSSLRAEEVLPLIGDPDAGPRQVAGLWISKQGRNVAADDLLRLLASRDPGLRVGALQMLQQAKLNAEQQRKVAELHARATAEERIEALRVLAGDSAALPLLWSELNHPDPQVRNAAVEGLTRHEAKAVGFVLKELAQATATQREGAVTVLATVRKLDFTPEPAMLQALRRTLDSENPVVRANVARALARASKLDKSSAAADIARRAATDPVRAVRDAGAQLCRKLGIPTPEYTGASITTVDETLRLVAKADAARGREIFFRQGSPGCFNCHQVNGQGRAIGPDLSDIGLRSDARRITEAVLEPNNEIIEGFQSTIIRTRNAMVYSGLVRDETEDTLVIDEASGESRRLDKKDIILRRISDVSIMPDNFGELLTPQETADLVAWMLSLKNPNAPVTRQHIPHDGD
jgi:quinoprotein glucose dehydrogenase